MSEEAQKSLAGLQNALLHTNDVEQFLHELAVLATRMVGDGDLMSCGMALRQRGKPAMATACSDPLASAGDQAQRALGEGPTAHAIRHARPVNIPDTATAQDWPRFCQRAASLGIHSCYVAPLSYEDKLIGVLVLYAREPQAFDAERAGRADKFARHAAGALALALRMATCTDQNEQLRATIGSRMVIDQALGVIMAMERCSQDKAFALLRRTSQNANVKIRDLAATIITGASGEPPQPAAPFEDG